MRPDGGEARRITDAQGRRRPTSRSAATADGSCTAAARPARSSSIGCRCAGHRQRRRPEQLTKHADRRRHLAVGARQHAASTSSRPTPSTRTRSCAARRGSPSTSATRRRRSRSLWALDLDRMKTTRLTEDGALLGARLLDLRRRQVGRLPRHVGRPLQAQHHRAEHLRRPVPARDRDRQDRAADQQRGSRRERASSFSPDGKWIAFSAPDDLDELQHDEQPRLPARASPSAASRSASSAASFDGDVTVGFWSKDGNTIYFNEGIKATNQLMALDVASRTRSRRSPTRRHRSRSIATTTRGVLLINYADGDDAVDDSSPSHRSTRSPTASAWKQLTDANPQVARLRARRAGRDHLEVEGRQDGRRRARQAGRLPGRAALSADRRDPRRARVGRRARLQRRLRLAGLRRRGLRRADAELSRLDQLRREAQDRHRRQLLPAGLRRHHDRRRSPDRAGHRRSRHAWACSAGAPAATGPTGSSRTPIASRRSAPAPARRTGSRCTRRATCSGTASSTSATSCRTTTSSVLEPVAAQVHQEREDADDDPRRRGRSARAEPAVGGAAHGAEAARRADGATVRRVGVWARALEKIEFEETKKDTKATGSQRRNGGERRRTEAATLHRPRWSNRSAAVSGGRAARAPALGRRQGRASRGAGSRSVTASVRLRSHRSFVVNPLTPSLVSPSAPSSSNSVFFRPLRPRDLESTSDFKRQTSNFHRLSPPPYPSPRTPRRCESRCARERLSPRSATARRGGRGRPLRSGRRAP